MLAHPLSCSIGCHDIVSHDLVSFLGLVTDVQAGQPRPGIRCKYSCIFVQKCPLENSGVGPWFLLYHFKIRNGGWLVAGPATQAEQPMGQTDFSDGDDDGWAW
jgi:hypothetical protein